MSFHLYPQQVEEENNKDNCFSCSTYTINVVSKDILAVQVDSTIIHNLRARDQHVHVPQDQQLVIIYWMSEMEAKIKYISKAKVALRLPHVNTLLLSGLKTCLTTQKWQIIAGTKIL